MNLSVIDYIGRINRLYRLIRMEHTGSLKELAEIMRVSERTISNYLEELRLMGADIRFSRLRNTYYFDNRFILYATFEARIETEILEEKSMIHAVITNNLKTNHYEKTKFLVLAALAAMFVGCQSENGTDFGNDRPSPTGDTRIIIEGKECWTHRVAVRTDAWTLPRICYWSRVI
ncbi:MAG: HTH domain-containing protein [Phocaeicola massiliensis]